MLKRISLKKISKYTVLLIVVFLFYLFPKKEDYVLTKSVEKEINAKFHDIFLLDKNNYVSKTIIEVNSNNEEKLVEELIEILIIDGKYQDKIPNGFKALLPPNTKLINCDIKDNTVILNFNNDLLDTSKEMEERIIESIIYTMTSIKGIDTVNINIEGKQLEKLNKSNSFISKNLKRDFGINKIYDITDFKNVTKIIIYYTSKTSNDYTYYVPVTKYINTNKDKIKIIIDELTSKISYESNLMSYLNSNTKLLDYSFNDDEIDLNFNEYLFDNNKNQKVLEEVIYSISYSLEDNYNISKVNFYVNNKEIK